MDLYPGFAILIQYNITLSKESKLKLLGGNGVIYFPISAAVSRVVKGLAAIGIGEGYLLNIIVKPTFGEGGYGIGKDIAGIKTGAQVRHNIVYK